MIKYCTLSICVESAPWAFSTLMEYSKIFPKNAIFMKSVFLGQVLAIM